MAKKDLSPLEVEIARWVKNVDGTVVPTGIMPIDYVLDGGIRTGRIVEIFGPEQSGKTTVMLNIVKAFLNQTNGKVIYVDTEHALDTRWAVLNGVNLSDHRIALIQPNSTNEALEVIEKLCRYKEVKLIVLDSLPALALEEELDSQGYHSAQPGLLARAFNRTLRVLTSMLPQNGSVFVFSNQLRSSMSPYGSPETTPGGRMKNYSTSYRLEIRKKDWIGTKQAARGIVSTVRAVKNKCGQPYRAAEIYITSKGLDANLSNFDILVMLGIIQRSGTYFTVNNTTIQGKDQTVTYVEQNYNGLYAIFKQKLEELTNENIGIEEETSTDE